MKSNWRGTNRKVLLVVSLAIASRAWAQPEEEKLEVVGFRADAPAVLVRYSMGSDQAPSILTLRAVDLTTGRTLASFPLLSSKEAGDRQKKRGERWREAERSLQKQGYRLTPGYAPLPRQGGLDAHAHFRAHLASLDLDAAFVLGAPRDENDLLQPVDLVVRRNGVQTLVRKSVALVPLYGGLGIQALYEDPAHRFLIAAIVVDSDRWTVVSVPLEDLRRALGPEPRSPECPSAEAALDALALGSADLVKGWKLEAGASKVTLVGPKVPWSRCREGDDASQYACTTGAGPAHVELRVVPRATFKCPAPLQRGPQRERMPRFENACFFYFASPPDGVRFEDTQLVVTAFRQLIRSRGDLFPAVPHCPAGD